MKFTSCLFSCINDWARKFEPTFNLATFILTISAISFAVISFIVPEIKKDNDFKNNTLVINCSNLYNAESIFLPGQNQTWDFNARYATDFYKSNWSEILLGLNDNQKQNYITMVNEMESSNIILERMEFNDPFLGIFQTNEVRDKFRVDTSNTLAKLADVIINKFMTLGVSSSTCVTNSFIE